MHIIPQEAAKILRGLYNISSAPWHPENKTQYLLMQCCYRVTP